MMERDCAVLYSEDLNPGQSYDGVQVVSPFDRDGAEGVGNRV